eukprot:scaffold2580_cov388-Prasinococcus_capsulatus_cf.AAC.5
MADTSGRASRNHSSSNSNSCVVDRVTSRLTPSSRGNLREPLRYSSHGPHANEQRQWNAPPCSSPSDCDIDVSTAD